jgi:hypothetical protein
MLQVTLLLLSVVVVMGDVDCNRAVLIVCTIVTGYYYSYLLTPPLPMMKQTDDLRSQFVICSSLGSINAVVRHYILTQSWDLDPAMGAVPDSPLINR